MFSHVFKIRKAKPLKSGAVNRLKMQYIQIIKKIFKTYVAANM